MKADVQYNDFIGSAAADISDHTELEAFLRRRGVDTKRYEAIGAQFYHSYAHFFNGSVICIDHQKSTEEKKHIVSMDFQREFSHEEFFDLFKRFNVMVTKQYYGYEDMKINEEITIEDLEKNEDEIENEGDADAK